MEKLIITGASGLLGSKKAKLAKKDYRVTPLHNNRPLYTDPLKLNIIERKHLFDLFSGLEPDVTVRTAARTFWYCRKCGPARRVG